MLKKNSADWKQHMQTKLWVCVSVREKALCSSSVLKVYECVSAVNGLVSKTAEELLIKFSLSEARKESQEKCWLCKLTDLLVSFNIVRIIY